MNLGTGKIEELGRRAVACKHWRWMPGMVTLPFHEDNDRSRPECHPPWRLTRQGVAGPFANDPTWGALPDLTDPATLGALLSLVREAWGEPALSVTAGYTKDRKVEWEVEHPHPDSLPEALWAYFDTEAEALVAALEAAP